LHRLREKLAALQAARTAHLAKPLSNSLPAAPTDIAGWENVDIFAHKRCGSLLGVENRKG
jgi:hypothetical protein